MSVPDSVMKKKWKRHSGPVSVEREKNAASRYKKKSRRVKTLFKKAIELQNISDCQVFVLVKDTCNRITFGGSPGLRNEFKNGTLHLQTEKRKELSMDFAPVHPAPTNQEHLKSIWPGNSSTEKEHVDSNVGVAADTDHNQVAADIELAADVVDDAVVEVGVVDVVDDSHVGVAADVVDDTDVELAADVVDGTDVKIVADAGVAVNGIEVEDDLAMQDVADFHQTEVETPGQESCVTVSHDSDDDDGDDDDDDGDDNNDRKPLSMLKNILAGKTDEVAADEDTIEDTGDTYTVAYVKKKRCVEGRVEYLVKWKGWGERYNSWEPEDHIIDKRLIAKFNKN